MPAMLPPTIATLNEPLDEVEDMLIRQEMS